MKYVMTVLLALLCSFANAKTYTYGVWSFELPDGAKESVDGGVRAFGFPGVVYLFTPPEALAGRTLEAIADATIADLTRGFTSGVKAAGTGDLNGGKLLAYTGPVTDSKTDAGRMQSYLFFERAGQWGLALTMVDITANTDVDQALAPLTSIKFAPSPAAVGGTAPSGAVSTPRLPALAWAAAPANRTASSRPGLDFPAARKAGFDPKTDLLPDTFDCYLGKTDDDEGWRPMTPTPDLRVAIQKGGTYAFNDGTTHSQGRWAKTLDENKQPRTRLMGPLGNVSSLGIYIYDDDEGQSFTASHTGSGREVRCYQAGPRAEAVRMELTKVRAGDGPMTCVDAGGGQPYTLNFATSGAGLTYSTPKGKGQARTFFSNPYGDWKGQAGFSGGPFDLGIGEMSEDENGNRRLTIEETTHESRGIFYRETNVRPVATCRARVQPRPRLLYGQTPAPKTGASSGVSGLFISNQFVTRFNGNFVNNSYEAQLSWFTPDGYTLDDIDPDDFGTLPDCTRTKPNGEPFCERYILKGTSLRLPDEDKAEAFKKISDGFVVGETEYHRATPPTAKSLPGVYDSNTDSSSGSQGGGSQIGIYNSLSGGYRFTPDGQFSWKYSSSSRTLISPNAFGNDFGGGVMGGSSSSFSDGGEGRYTLDGHWLSLNLTDGRKFRRFVYTQPASFLKDDPTLGQRLNLGGSWLKWVGKP
ncbi:hypothetical protein E7T06_20635 [Deinococcus sp. Arct2-2]|uniref:hypothetical protein n=1 Tax=Deinococcus sp. Arct2-2 TaxID=2568653 RepID=UPI0010A55EFB|nr:hypothetical protein [Deinococcus sp. Arct2-2]THF66711.1 hypothetical protein E7T06_20635 [Deinococcus sp. Arct2-2]